MPQKAGGRTRAGPLSASSCSLFSLALARAQTHFPLARVTWRYTSTAVYRGRRINHKHKQDVHDGNVGQRVEGLREEEKKVNDCAS